MASKGVRQEEPRGGEGGAGAGNKQVTHATNSHEKPDVFNESDTARQSIYAGPELHQNMQI